MAGESIGDALRQIGRLFSGGAVAGQSDAALLHRFVAASDEEAFAGLVARHGPMVLAVCRGMLRDPADAEDAFQATFLVLVRRAGSIWVDDSLGGWLYRVAHRVALRANADARKRKARERQGVEMDAIAGRDEGARDRPGAELHAEIARLPEALRRALVLCDLEGMTQVEAARLLHCGEATLRRRLAGARERLRVRLARHRVAPSAVAALAKAPPVPAAWVEATIRTAVAGASGRLATSAGRLAASVVDADDPGASAPGRGAGRVRGRRPGLGLGRRRWPRRPARGDGGPSPRPEGGPPRGIAGAALGPRQVRYRVREVGLPRRRPEAEQDRRGRHPRGPRRGLRAEVGPGRSQDQAPGCLPDGGGRARRQGGDPGDDDARVLLSPDRPAGAGAGQAAGRQPRLRGEHRLHHIYPRDDRRPSLPPDGHLPEGPVGRGPAGEADLDRPGDEAADPESREARPLASDQVQARVPHGHL